MFGLRTNRTELTFFLEREIFSKMSTFVITAEHEEGVWEVDFVGVKVEETLAGRKVSSGKNAAGRFRRCIRKALHPKDATSQL